MPIDRVDQQPYLPAWRRFGLAALACVLMTAVTLPLRQMFDLANIVVLFLLTVFLVAFYLQRGPAVLAALMSVGLFDFFFVPPHLSFAVADVQYVVTLAVMLMVGLITAHLTARLSEQTEQARWGESETQRLYEVARDMAAAATREQVVTTIDRYLSSRQLEGRILLADERGEELFAAPDSHAIDGLEKSFALSAYHRAEVVEVDTLAETGMAVVFIPLRTVRCTYGVLAVKPLADTADPVRSSRKALETIASLTALAIERLHFADLANRAGLQVAEERLRTSILSSLSHDLRTPLTALVGLADSLAEGGSGAGNEIREEAAIVRDQAHAMHRLLTNLLDMARLQGEQTALRCEWQPFEEVMGSSIRIVHGTCPDRVVETEIEADLPLVHLDAVLIERVLCNLLDNAIKYSPPAARIVLAAKREAGNLVVSVCNEGSGFPEERLEEVFRLFVRGSSEPSLPGVGLGLAICRTIVVAHGGEIAAENKDGKACVRFTLPLGDPPGVEDEAP